MTSAISANTKVEIKITITICQNGRKIVDEGTVLITRNLKKDKKIKKKAIYFRLYSDKSLGNYQRHRYFLEDFH